LILTLVNYQSGAVAQPEGAVDSLRMVFSVLPILCTLIAMYVMSTYKVDEAYARDVRAQLDAKK